MAAGPTSLGRNTSSNLTDQALQFVVEFKDKASEGMKSLSRKFGDLFHTMQQTVQEHNVFESETAKATETVMGLAASLGLASQGNAKLLGTLRTITSQDWYGNAARSIAAVTTGLLGLPTSTSAALKGLAPQAGKGVAIAGAATIAGMSFEGMEISKTYSDAFAKAFATTNIRQTNAEFMKFYDGLADVGAATNFDAIQLVELGAVIARLGYRWEQGGKQMVATTAQFAKVFQISTTEAAAFMNAILLRLHPTVEGLKTIEAGALAVGKAFGIGPQAVMAAYGQVLNSDVLNVLENAASGLGVTGAAFDQFKVTLTKSQGAIATAFMQVGSGAGDAQNAISALVDPSNAAFGMMRALFQAGGGTEGLLDRAKATGNWTEAMIALQTGIRGVTKEFGGNATMVASTYGLSQEFVRAMNQADLSKALNAEKATNDMKGLRTSLKENQDTWAELWSKFKTALGPSIKIFGELMRAPFGRLMHFASFLVDEFQKLQDVTHGWAGALALLGVTALGTILWLSSMLKFVILLRNAYIALKATQAGGAILGAAGQGLGKLIAPTGLDTAGATLGTAAATVMSSLMVLAAAGIGIAIGAAIYQYLIKGGALEDWLSRHLPGVSTKSDVGLKAWHPHGTIVPETGPGALAAHPVAIAPVSPVPVTPLPPPSMPETSYPAYGPPATEELRPDDRGMTADGRGIIKAVRDATGWHVEEMKREEVKTRGAISRSSRDAAEAASEATGGFAPGSA